ncbi:hypothetical protein Tco_1064102, partial [Tanacetum coccineum]
MISLVLTKSYNNDVKHGYVTQSLSNEDAEYLQLFEEEIEERLKHHDQMRHWEMLVPSCYVIFDLEPLSLSFDFVFCSEIFKSFLLNVQFLQQLQPEWSRFVTVVKQREEIDTVSYHKLFDVLKQFQNEVNDIRSERLAKSANPLALLAAAQPYSNNYYHAPKPQRSNAPSYTQSSSRQPSASTRHKGKEIAKPVTPQSESVYEEDSDPEQDRRDKDMKKNLALLDKYFKKLYKPTNN